MMSGIDLSRLPAPAVVEEISFESILDGMLDQLRERDPEQLKTIEQSDPAYAVLEVAAYREMIMRKRVNEAGRAVMLAYAAGGDLDHLAAFYNVERLQVDAGDPRAVPPRAPVFESDDDFRKRIQLSTDGFSVAGPAGAYRFHALSSDGRVLDASATSPAPGEVLVSVLARAGDGHADQPLLDVVNASVNAEDKRPLTDYVRVESAHIITYRIDATIYCYAGPDSTVVIDNARAAARKYADEQHRIGHAITRSGVYAALHQPGVQRVELCEPAALANGHEKLDIDRVSAPWCQGIDIAYGGTDG